MAVVYDFSSYANAKEKERKSSEMAEHFLRDIYPYMSPAEFAEMKVIYSSNDVKAKNEYIKRMEEVAEFRAFKRRLKDKRGKRKC